MKRLLPWTIYAFLGVYGHRYGALMRTLQTGLLVTVLGGATAWMLLQSNVVPVIPDLPTMVVSSIIGAMYAKMESRYSFDSLLRTLVFSTGCATLYIGGLLWSKSSVNAYGLTIDGFPIFIAGLYIVFRIYAEGKTSLTTAESVHF